MYPLRVSNRLLLILSCHAAIIGCALALAFLLRFDFILPESQLDRFRAALFFAIVIKMAIFLLARLHRTSWRFASTGDLVRVFTANVVASALFITTMMAFSGPGFPRSIYAMDFVLCFLFTAGARFSVRLYAEMASFERAKLTRKGKGVLIYGAGAAGRMLLREIQANSALECHALGFLDDDPQLRDVLIMNVPVLGSGRDAAHIVDQYRNRVRKVDEIIITMPSASGRQMMAAVANCRAAGVPCKTLPSIGEMLEGKGLSAQIRNVSMEELLGRKPVRLEADRIQRTIKDTVVLVTGAAGSIGSELCRQIAYYEPAKLIAFDQAESDLFKIDLELRETFPLLDVVAEIGDIREAGRIDDVIRKHSVGSIFHAAAYKHVPMMELHLLEAVKNNIFGTWNLVKSASQNRVPRFLMISSDKAVNPTNVMGATKRVSELIVSAMAAAEGTRFVSVRFGNVLGSNGSVVPLFQKQIASGGPVKVTHPEIRRFFMSIPEAVQLVLQASTMGNGSEIFVLDMGEPVKILDLAHNMIRLAGLAPGKDIEVRFTGLRPGEKLYEELQLELENLQPTYHEKIKILKGPAVKQEILDPLLNRLQLLVARADPPAVLQQLRTLVPEYRPDPRWIHAGASSEETAASPGYETLKGAVVAQ
jgi:FlaA1/EpsC-like NDP-sugar epimerase